MWVNESMHAHIYAIRESTMQSPEGDDNSNLQSNAIATAMSPSAVPEPHATSRRAPLEPEAEPAGLEAVFVPLPVWEAGLPAPPDLVTDEPPDAEGEDPLVGGETAARLLTVLHVAAELAEVSLGLYGNHETAPDEESCTRAVVEAK
jgi:hypothetical protein